VSDRTLSISGVVLAALVVSLLGVGPGQAAAIRWLQATDDREPWELALDLAQKDREPVMAFVYIGNSQLAQMMDDRTFRDKAVCDAARKFECVRVDALRPENRPLVDKLGLGGAAGTAGQQKYEGGVHDVPVQGHTFPVTIFISPDGVPEHMVYGFMIPEDFSVTMGQVLEVVQIREGLKKKPDDAPALARLGGLYVTLQRYEAAREPLEQAIKLDPTGAQGGGDGARLDLAVAMLAAGECDRGIALITEEMGLFPEGGLTCKAHYLLGGALLAAAETAQKQADRLTAQKDEKGVAEAREQAQAGRRQAEEAWRWFEARGGGKTPPCDGTEWSTYALGALEEMRTEIDFRTAEAIALSGDHKAAAVALREFVAAATAHLEELNRRNREKGAGSLREPARIFTATFLTGQELMAAQEYGEAVDHWRKFLDRYPLEPKGKPVVTPDTEVSCEGAYLLGECLLRMGKRNEALAQWKKIADPDGKKNPCAYTPSCARAAGAVEADAKWP
jgi:tetratricopeptide (TPR) repeat protein